MTPTTLFKAQELGKTCISVIIPLHNELPAIMQVKDNIRKIQDLLKDMQQVVTILDHLAENIDYTNTVEGIGIYITQGFHQLVEFQFPVQYKIHIGDSFWIKELVSLDYYKVPYYVLRLSRNDISLYKGKLNTIKQINDRRFPHEISSTLNRGSVMVTSKVAVKPSLVSADSKLCHYLKEELLMLAGPEKCVMQFHEITDHWRNIAGTITGIDDEELEENAWLMIRKWLDNHKEVLANEWLAKASLQKLSDVRDIWRTAVAGKGMILMAESNYSLPVFQDKIHGSIHMKAPGNAYRIITDVVNEIMTLVLQKGGEVIIVKDGTLDAYNRMVLLSYP